MNKRKKHTFTISEAAKKKLALNLSYGQQKGATYDLKAVSKTSERA